MHYARTGAAHLHPVPHGVGQGGAGRGGPALAVGPVSGGTDLRADSTYAGLADGPPCPGPPLVALPRTELALIRSASAVSARGLEAQSFLDTVASSGKVSRPTASRLISFPLLFKRKVVLADERRKGLGSTFAVQNDEIKIFVLLALRHKDQPTLDH